LQPVKNQYVGDVSDFFKYALLREAARQGMDVGLAWWLTPDDGGSDGRHLGYLDLPEDYRLLDPELFDALRGVVASSERSLDSLLVTGILGRTVTFSEPVPSSEAERDTWRLRLAATVSECDFIFADPDNGLAVQSVPAGKPAARKYVYPADVTSIAGTDSTLCVYQHFPRVPRAPYVRAQSQRLSALWNVRGSFALCTSRVAFLIAPPAAHEDVMRGVARELVSRAPEHFQIVEGS
jgi:hypothetical protein